MLHVQTRIFYIVYTTAYYLALPFIFLRLLLRSRKQPGYRQRLKERFRGFSGHNPLKPSLWIHSVSVGETIAATPLIEHLLKIFPYYNIHVTTTTPTGSAQVTQHFKDRVTHSYLPYDIPYALKHFFRSVQPRLCLIMETELWPNLLFLCYQKNIPTLLANGRLSTRSYQRYAKLGVISRDILNLFSKIAAQSQSDAEHYRTIGIVNEKITVTGNLKFDKLIPPTLFDEAQKFAQLWGLCNRPILIAASTRENEEPYVLTAFTTVKKKYPNALLILVPRHLDRIEKVVRLCEKNAFKTVLRSQLASPLADTDILIGNTIGELMLLYALSDIAYVGGSLVDTGGHNILEPAALSLPIITGPYLRNFKTISHMLVTANAQLIIHTADTLAEAFLKLLADEPLRREMGAQGCDIFRKNKGAIENHLQLIKALVPTHPSSHDQLAKHLKR